MNIVLYFHFMFWYTFSMDTTKIKNKSDFSPKIKNVFWKRRKIPLKKTHFNFISKFENLFQINSIAKVTNFTAISEFVTFGFSYRILIFPLQSNENNNNNNKPSGKKVFFVEWWRCMFGIQRLVCVPHPSAKLSISINKWFLPHQKPISYFSLFFFFFNKKKKRLKLKKIVKTIAIWCWIEIKFPKFSNKKKCPFNFSA